MRPPGSPEPTSALFLLDAAPELGDDLREWPPWLGIPAWRDTPEMVLLWAVLADAMHTIRLEKPGDERGGRYRQRRWEEAERARRWMHAEDRTTLCGFGTICDVLQIDAGTVWNVLARPEERRRNLTLVKRSFTIGTRPVMA